MEVRERILSYLWLLFVPYLTGSRFCLWVGIDVVFVAVDASMSEIERHLEMGKSFLAKGQFSDALTHYHAAVGMMLVFIWRIILWILRSGSGQLPDAVPSCDGVPCDGQVEVGAARS
jgi:hypothetical protein